MIVTILALSCSACIDHFISTVSPVSVNRRWPHSPSSLKVHKITDGCIHPVNFLKVPKNAENHDWPHSSSMRGSDCLITETFSDAMKNGTFCMNTCSSAIGHFYPLTGKQSLTILVPSIYSPFHHPEIIVEYQMKLNNSTTMMIPHHQEKNSHASRGHMLA